MKVETHKQLRASMLCIIAFTLGCMVVFCSGCKTASKTQTGLSFALNDNKIKKRHL